MKNKIQFILLLGVLAFSKSIFSQEPENPELSEGPQTLPALEQAPKTESISTPESTIEPTTEAEMSNAITEDAVKSEEIKSQPESTPEAKKPKSPGHTRSVLYIIF